MSTKVINLKSTYAGPVVYIGRPGPFGNPFKIGRDGSREEVIAKFKEWVEQSPDPKAHWIRTHLHFLKEKTLGCFCKPLPCHGDVLAEWTNDNPFIVRE